MTVSDLESTAYHEAGHGFCRAFFNMEIAELSINGEKGNCRFRVPDRGDISLLQDIAGSLAGKIAEDRLRGSKGEHDAGDYHRAFDCALRLNGGDKQGAELLLKWMSYRTDKLVSKHFDTISRLAFKLLDSLDNNGVGRLTGEQIHEVIGKKAA
jgi:hypothetical protein